MGVCYFLGVGSLSGGSLISQSCHLPLSLTQNALLLLNILSYIEMYATELRYDKNLVSLVILHSVR